jgi:hypothetical protein
MDNPSHETILALAKKMDICDNNCIEQHWPNATNLKPVVSVNLIEKGQRL